MNRIKIGISAGDFNGIGMEVILKTFDNPKMLELCTPVLYSSAKVLSYHKNIVDLEDFAYVNQRSAERLEQGKFNVVNCWQDNVNINIGQATEAGGKYAMIALEQAVHDLKAGYIDALVTAPINKEAMSMAGFGYIGHTEFLGKHSDGGEPLMLLISEDMRMGMVTTHVPLSEVAPLITKVRVMQKIAQLNDTLKMDFGIEKPTIAVLGLNPHAGDGGVIGKEDQEILHPAVLEMKKKGTLAFGPFPSDSFFGSGQYKKFDAILAMYHDQGLIPFKTLSFHAGVNYTAGLSFVRTSPDHGTGYDISGTNVADPESFRQAVFAAIDILRSRRSYIEDRKDTLQKHALEREEEIS